MRTGKPTEIESQGIREDGSHFDVRIQAYPVFGEKGKPRAFIEVVEDSSDVGISTI